MPAHSWHDPDDDAPDGGLDAFDYLSPSTDEHQRHDHWSRAEPAPSTNDEYDDWSAHTPIAEEPAAEPAQSPAMLLFAVTNPAGTVTAKAAVSGRIEQVELSAAVVTMTEAQLARDVIATAELANLKGRSAQHSLIEGILSYQGLDRQTAREFLDHHMDLPTPQQAEAAEAQVRAQYLRGEH